MGHVMKTATVRDLRYHFSEIESRLQKGEEVEIRKRRRVIARLVPVRPKAEAYPDFAARARKIFGDKVVHRTGAELMALERDRY
jgi:antitoxin (DNA-binding transcriptional repressor) of toxin-antitoxin stability system